MLASGNATSLYCRAVRSHEEPVNHLKFDGNFSGLSLDNKEYSGAENFVKIQEKVKENEV